MSYFSPDDLKKFSAIQDDAPEVGKSFFDYYAKVFEEGELTTREKNLIALAVAHTTQCPYCIDAYTTATLESGCSRGELMEAVHVAAAIRGGSSLVHATQMQKHADKLSM